MPDSIPSFFSAMSTWSTASAPLIALTGSGASGSRVIEVSEELSRTACARAVMPSCVSSALPVRSSSLSVLFECSAAWKAFAPSGPNGGSMCASLRTSIDWLYLSTPAISSTMDGSMGCDDRSRRDSVGKTSSSLHRMERRDAAVQPGAERLKHAPAPEIAKPHVRQVDRVERAHAGWHAERTEDELAIALGHDYASERRLGKVQARDVRVLDDQQPHQVRRDSTKLAHALESHG
eukprot:6651546-Prymnesium_polylepis.2